MTNVLRYPEGVKFHKKTAELQAKISFPEANEKGSVEKKGALFFELAKAIPGDADGRMDWSNKIIMKIGLNDIGQILYGLRTKQEEIKCFHQNDRGSSTLIIKPGRDGSYQLAMFKKVGEQSFNGSLYLSGQDMIILCNILEASITKTIGWS